MTGSWGRRACALVVAGLLVAACGGDGDDAEETSSSDGAGETTAPVDDGETTTEAESTTTEAEEVFMPDLIGQTEDEAREELGEIGVEDDVQVVERESLEEAGTIIEQVPSSGQRISGSVNLVVAKPVGPVPDFVGQQISDVEEWAEERGIEVRTEEILDDAVSDGEVIATTPAADAEATSEILVQVARTPVISNLAEVDSVGNDCSNYESGEAQVNGDSYANSLMLRASECGVEFNLGRDWQRLKATIGLRDDSDSGASYRFEVFGDGTSLLNEVVTIGEIREVDVDVTDVLRLRIQITRIGDDAYGYAVWGGIRVVGSPDQVEGDEPVEGEDGSTTTTEP